MKLADCAHCGKTVLEFAPGKWKHANVPGYSGSVGCRAASFTSADGWDDSLSRNWKATPKKGTERDTPGLQDGAGRDISMDQFRTWVVSQAIRNRLEMFHGGEAIDPDDPSRNEGFVSDGQMKALNIVIRYTVHEALTMLAKLPDDTAAFYCQFHLMTVSDYMEPPGTPELQRAYTEISGGETTVDDLRLP